MGLKAEKVFVNLPVKDLGRTMAFFSKIGFEFNPQFTNENAACLILGDTMFAMLLNEAVFKTFTKKGIVDATKKTEAILALAVDDRDKVDEIVQKALSSGGQPSNDPVDHGFMYGWSFQDVDGHLWEVFYMEEKNVVSMKH